MKDSNGPALREGEAEERAGSRHLQHRELPGMNVCETVQEAAKCRDEFGPRYSFVTAGLAFYSFWASPRLQT